LADDSRWKINTFYKSKYINHKFKINQNLSTIFKNNMDLQKKIDEINKKGAGNVPSPLRQRKRLTSGSFRSDSGPNEKKISMIKKPAGSLNYINMRNEMRRIDFENWRLAQKLVEPHRNFSSVKPVRISKNYIDISKQMEFT
jgi:hypothetical protein